MMRVALTGGIASGKSAAADAFRQLGVPVIDADRLARANVVPGSAGLNELVKEFGAEILNASGELDRASLRARIFSDTTARERVNAILHPLILATLEEELAKIRAPYVIVEVPLLIETGLHKAFDRVLVVDAQEETQVSRLRKRDGVDEAAARAAVATQASREQRLACATEVLGNDRDLASLRADVYTLHMQYQRDAEQFASSRERRAE